MVFLFLFFKDEPKQMCRLPAHPAIRHARTTGLTNGAMERPNKQPGELGVARVGRARRRQRGGFIFCRRRGESTIEEEEGGAGAINVVVVLYVGTINSKIKRMGSA